MDYRREIDGLRALAVLPVILFHAGFETFSGGFVGVDVFFVISGYLITTIILSELEQGTFSIVNFYERRARRILPALFLVIFVSIPFAWFWLLPSDMKEFSQSLVSVPFFTSNIFFLRESGYFDTAAELKPLLHTWSLAVEEQYYLLFPLFLMWFWRLGKRWILVLLGLAFITSLAVAQWAAYANPAAAFYLLPTRGWELLTGAFAAFYLSQAKREAFSQKVSEAGGWVGVALILYAVFNYSKATPFPGLYALIPTLGTLLVILFATQQTTAGRFVGNKTFVGLGLISYSAYLWHQPVFAFARHRSILDPSHTLFLLLFVLILILAYMTWKFVEAPFRRKSLIKRSAVFSYAGICSILTLVLGFSGHVFDGFSDRLPSDIATFTSATQEYVKLRDDGGCNLFKDMVSPKFCVKGDLAVPPTFALIGDSHAASLAPELSKKLKAERRSFVQITKNACPFGEGVRDGSADNCERFNQVVVGHLKSSSYDTIIVSSRWSWYLSDDDFDNAEGGVESRRSFPFTAGALPITAPIDARRREVLKAYHDSLSSLLQSKKKIVLVYPIPEQGWNAPIHLAKLKLFSDRASLNFGIKQSVYESRNLDVVKLFDSLGDHSNLFRILPGKVFCNTVLSERCVAYDGNRLFYYDDDHLASDGAKMLVDEVYRSLH